MAIVLEDCKIFFEGLDVSGNANNAEISQEVDALRVDAFGKTTAQNKAGTLSYGLSLAGFADVAEVRQWRTTLAARASTPILVVPEGATVGNTAMLFSALLAQLKPIGGGKGEIAMYSVQAVPDSNGHPLVDGVLAEYGSQALGANVGPVYALGKVADGQSLYSAQHVLSVSGTSPTLDAVVQGGTDPTYVLGVGWVGLDDSIFDKPINDMFWDAGFGAVLVCNDGIVYHSSELVRSDSLGPNYTKIDLGTIDELNAVAHSGAEVVLVGDNGRIHRSTGPGVSWAAKTSGETDHLFGIVYAESQFVVVGALDAGDAIVLTSPDGNTWTPRSSGIAEAFYDVAYDTVANYLAVGSNGVIASSGDGTSWAEVTDSKLVANDLLAVDCGNGVCVGVGAAGALLTCATSDINDWTVRTSNTALQLNDVKHLGNGIWVAVGVSGAVVKSIDNGVTWALQNSVYNEASTAGQNLNTIGIRANSTQAFIAGAAQKIYYSCSSVNLQTFAQANAVGAEGVKALAGQQPYSHYRFSNTVGGSASPSFDVAQFIGVE